MKISGGILLFLPLVEFVCVTWDKTDKNRKNGQSL